MPTGFNAKPQYNGNVKPLVNGYGGKNSEPDLFIPSCGIEDVDRGLFNLFDQEIKPVVGGLKNDPVSKVPIIFAAGEKWSLLKNGRPLRDKNNVLILPLITILRTSINQNVSSDVVGRGINQQTGEMVIRKKLDKSDRAYQNLINRMLLNGQDNVFANNTVIPTLDVQPKTNRDLGFDINFALPNDQSHISTIPNLTNNVIETLVVPSPQFYTAQYEVTIWTQYVQHMNQIIEKIMTSFLPQGQSWQINTDKGYWFVAKPDDASFNTTTSFDDLSSQERFVKCVFTITVPAYFFASDVPGNPIPVKRYISSPSIHFDTFSDTVQEENDSQYILGSDDPTLPLNPSEKKPMRLQGTYPVYPMQDGKLVNDPAITSLRRADSIKVISTNAKGETAYSGASLSDLRILFEK